MPFLVGENIGPYRISEQLGHGGMATVFKAYHAALDRYVAIKALHPAFTAEPNFLERFQREARVVAKLEHPNIVPIYDFSEHEGRPYLVMKFIEGETLKARLNQGALSQAELDQVIESVGAALDYAHKQGVLHRDVKPSNVLIATDGRIYLADFGLARMAEAGESTISNDVMLGTPQYISPEQALGKRDLDNGTDIYSFGVLIYELVVGQVPFSADTPYSVIHDHIYTPLPMPRSLRADIPEQVERVLLKAMAKERADRFTDVAALVAAWKQAVASQPGAALPAAPDLAALKMPGEPAQTPALTLTPAPALTPPPLPPTVRAGTLPGEPAPVQATAAAAPAKSYRGWLWLFIGISVALCLVIASLLGFSPPVRARLRGILLGQPLPPVTEPLGGDPGFAPPTRIGIVGEKPTPVSMEDAKERLEAEPDSAYAHLEMGVAYLENDDLQKAGEEFELAMQHAGDDPRFYSTAGKVFAQHQQMLRAAQAFTQAANLGPQPVTRETMEAWMQTLYLASSDPGFGDFFESASLQRVDPRFLEVVEARYHLHVQHNIEEASEVFNRLAAEPQPIYEVWLLEAEILGQQGELQLAREKLRAIAQDQQAPLWVRAIAEKILKVSFN